MISATWITSASSKTKGLEGAYEQVDKRLEEMNRSIEGLRTDMNSRFNEVNGRFVSMAGLDHVQSFDRTDLVLSHIREFLSRVS